MSDFDFPLSVLFAIRAVIEKNVLSVLQFRVLLNRVVR